MSLYRVAVESPWQPVNVDMKCLVAHRFVEESGQNIIRILFLMVTWIEFLILTLV